MKYNVYDSLGNILKSFNSIKEAQSFLISNNRYDWNIKIAKSNKKSTERQRAAVHFCEQFLNVEFTGNINDFYQVSDFLSEYLEDAKRMYEELLCEYEAYLWDLD